MCCFICLLIYHQYWTLSMATIECVMPEFDGFWTQAYIKGIELQITKLQNKSTARRGIIRPKAVLFTQVAKFYRNFRSKLKRKIRKNCDLFVCLTLYVPLTFSNFIWIHQRAIIPEWRMTWEISESYLTDMHNYTSISIIAESLKKLCWKIKEELVAQEIATRNYQRAITPEWKMIWELSHWYAQLHISIYHSWKFEEIMLKNKGGVSCTRNCYPKLSKGNNSRIKNDTRAISLICTTTHQYLSLLKVWRNYVEK